MSGAEILAAVLVTILAGLETVIAALTVKELARKRDKKWASLRSAWLRVSISAVLALVAVDLWIGRRPPFEGVIGLILIVSFGGAVVLLLIDIGRDLARAISVRRNRPAGPPARRQPAPIPAPAVAGLHVSGVAVHDPGWAEALKSTTPIVGPIRMMRAQASGGENPLVALRAIYVALLASLPLFLFVLSFIVPWDGSSAQDWFAGLVAIYGAAAIGLVQWARHRPLSLGSPKQLAASYRALFFIGVGYAQSAALLGFVGVFLTDSLWVYVLGMGFGLLGLALLAPTRADITRRQQQIASLDSTMSLLEALVVPTEDDPRSAGTG
jgi:hypothetical protein